MLPLSLVFAVAGVVWHWGEGGAASKMLSGPVIRPSSVHSWSDYFGLSSVHDHTHPALLSVFKS